MRALIATTLFGGALALSATAQQPPSGAPPTVPGKAQPSPATLPNDLKATGPDVALEGVFNIVSGERDGKAVPEEEIKGAMVRIAQGKLICTDKDRTEFFAAKYTVDATKTPWKIALTTEDGTEGTAGETKPKATAVTTTGLVKRDGTSLTLIYALPGGEAPTEFKTKAKQQMFVLKSLVGDAPVPNKFTKP